MRHGLRGVVLLVGVHVLAPMPAWAQSADRPTIHAVTTLGSMGSTADRSSRNVRLSGGLVAEVELLTIEMRLPFWTLLGEPVLNPVARWRWEEGARIHLRGGPNGARLVTFTLDGNADEIGIYDGGQSVTVPREIFERHARLIDFHYVLTFSDLEGVGTRPEALVRRYGGVVDGRPDEWGWNVAGSPNWAELIANAADGVPEPGRPPARGYLPEREARRVFELQMRQCGGNTANRPLPMAPELCEANGSERFLPYGLQVSMMGLIWETQRLFPEFREMLWPEPRDRQLIALAGALAGRVDEETPRRAELLRRTVDTFRDELDPTAVALAEAELERIGNAEVDALEAELRAAADLILGEAQAGAVEESTYDRLAALRERAEALTGSSARRLVAQARGLERLGAPVVWVEIEYQGDANDAFLLAAARPDGDGGVNRVRRALLLHPPDSAVIYDKSGRPETLDLGWRVGKTRDFSGTIAVPFQHSEVAELVTPWWTSPYFHDGWRVRITWGPCSTIVTPLLDAGFILGIRRYENRAEFSGQPRIHAVDGPAGCVVHSGSGEIWFDPFAGSGR